MTTDAILERVPSEHRNKLRLVFDEALAMHEAYHRLGYDPSWIFVEDTMAPTRDVLGKVTDQVYRLWRVVLSVPRDQLLARYLTKEATLTFRMDVGVLPPVEAASSDLIREYWTSRVDAWNATPESIEIYNASNILQRATELLLTLCKRGLYPLVPAERGAKAARKHMAAALTKLTDNTTPMQQMSDHVTKKKDMPS